MRGGLTILLGAAAAVTAGCAAKTGQIQVRSLSDPASKLGAGSERLAEARGQLALGNVGLAIEGFHAALREQPDSVEAMGGLASCYDSMGRSDLSRQYFEAALAVAPRNPAVLNAFAASLDAQGQRVEALALRSEAAQASRPVVAAPAPVLAAVKAPAPVIVVASAPAPRPVAAVKPAPASVAVEAPAPVFVAAVPAAPAFGAPASLPGLPVAVPAAQPPAAPPPPSAPAPVVPASAVVAVVPAGTSVTIPLAPARPVASPAMTVAVDAQDLPPPPPPPAPVLTVLESTGPRLQRLSMGEVALVTTSEPIWQRPRIAARTASGTAVHWVALNDGAARPNIRLLNAARSQGLAARTRAYLMARGWRNIEIGDADRVRPSSLVMYPEHRQTTGRILAGQFNFRPGMAQQGETIVVYLGRDAVAGRGALARG